MFKVGDVVRLKSGGPKMTVFGVTSKGAFCYWFSGDDKRESKFEMNTLEVAKD